MYVMSNLSEKTTIYLNPNVKKFLQHKAIAENRSLSDLVNEQFADMLEDLSDIKDIAKRRAEKTTPFDKVLEDLGITYDQLQG
jgi:hypothetical protein